MKKIKLLALSSAVAAAMSGFSTTAVAGASANIGVASNYLWRGVSLSNDAAEVSGGVDYSHESGAYAGIWQSSEGAVAATGGNSTGETDVYAGFSGEASGISYDVGFTAYKYLQNDTSDFNEVFFSVGYQMASFYYATSSDLDADYMSLTLEYDKYSFVFGDYSGDGITDYTHFDLSAALTDELSITYSKNDLAGDDNGRIVVAYGLEFEL